MDDALPTVGMTMRFLALCDLYGSRRAAVGLLAEGRRAGAPGLPGDDDWARWSGAQMRAVVDYLESRRGMNGGVTARSWVTLGSTLWTSWISGAGRRRMWTTGRRLAAGTITRCG